MSDFMAGPTATVRRRTRRKRKGAGTAQANTTTTTSHSVTTSAIPSVDEAVAVASSNTSGGVESVLRKLRDSVGDGDLYTALQVYKALFARFAKQGDVEHATELAVKGTCLLLRRGLTRAATDLANNLVELFIDSHTKAEDNNTLQLLTIARTYPTHPDTLACEGSIDDTCDEDAQRFLGHAIKWSSAEGAMPRGDPRLNYEAALAHRRTGDASNACLRYMFAEKCEEYAAYIHELASQGGYRGELDLFLARAVLQLLAVENVRDANLVCQSFMEHCSNSLDTPLVNFVVLLLDTVRRGKDALPLFQLLQKRYERSLSRDETLQACMGRIANKFFGVAPQRQGGLMGMLEGLMSGGK